MRRRRFGCPARATRSSSPDSHEIQGPSTASRGSRRMRNSSTAGAPEPGHEEGPGTTGIPATSRSQPVRMPPLTQSMKLPPLASSTSDSRQPAGARDPGIGSLNIDERLPTPTVLQVGPWEAMPTSSTANPDLTHQLVGIDPFYT